MQNQETVKYLNILIENLEKKQSIFDILLEKTVSQNECVAGKDQDSANWSQFEVLMIEKDSAIEKVDEIDSAFESIFARIKPELDSNKDEYADLIKKLQASITKLTDTGVKISSVEERNRAEVERIMTAAKAGIGKARKNLKATSGYIASMYGSAMGADPTKIDSKKQIGAYMKLLFYSFDSYSDPDVCEVLSQMNISFDIFKYDFEAPGHNKNYDEEFIFEFSKKYQLSKYDAVFSIDFWPPIAMACYKNNIKYVAWSYDCPFDLLNPEEALALPNVYCFVFDKEQRKTYFDIGINNIFYMPLGVNVSRYKKIDRSNSKCNKYKTDVSFVGKLYENSYPLIRAGVNDNTANLLDRIIETQTNLLPNNVLGQLVTEGLVNVINDEMHANDPDFCDTATKGKIIYALESEITRKERIAMLNLCGRRYKTDFYSKSNFDLLEGVNKHGYVNYWEEMPWIFAASKINLNPTLKAIHAGVSLRAFDITACGGFMLTNRQAELEELFTVGEEIGGYNNIVDFVEKLEYYMTHEEERLKIAEAGRNRCFKDHGMDKRLKEIFKIADL